MGRSLNPDAPCFISSSHNLIPSSPLQVMAPQENPITYLYPSTYPLHFQLVQMTHGNSTECAYPSPLQLSWPPYAQMTHGNSRNDAWHQYYSYLINYPTLQLPSPLYASALPRCTIQELDENPADPKSDTTNELIVSEPTSKALVVNRRRIRVPKEERAIIRSPRCQEMRRRSSVRASHCNYEISTDANFEREGKTTLMIKNLPSKFSKERMLAILRDHCIEENQKAVASLGDQAVLSEFDYFYLPIDFRTNSNFGFAFVNFTSPIGASRLYKHLHNYKWTAAGSNKVCAVNYARIQGLAQSIEHAHRMTFGRCMPDMFMPVQFKPPYNGLNTSEEILLGKRIMSMSSNA